MIIRNTGLESVADLRLPDGPASEEKLVTVFIKINPYLFVQLIRIIHHIRAGTLVDFYLVI